MLLTDSAEECGTEAVRFDIADVKTVMLPHLPRRSVSLTWNASLSQVGREWLQSVSCVSAYHGLVTAWQANYSSPSAKAAAVAKAGEDLSSALLDIDELLSSTPGFLFGEWIRDATALGTTDAGRAQLASNAKIQVTGSSPASSVHAGGLRRRAVF